MNDNTMIYTNGKSLKNSLREVLDIVFDALIEKGYNANDQIVGYILSGDPSYITSHNNARKLIKEIDRDIIIEELLKSYLEK
ncbi:MAG: IreB family regulatory phosphoprotein [Clostridiales Family XIII bacterium]|jgi:uncharacterized protein (UPF0297 family)|nr:IreB family regulatory phosphoprotein [Clostridiales Family XIII bacterium]